MKHILNDLTETEKNSIREQHKDFIKIETTHFNKLVESKLGNVKPINEQVQTPSNPTSMSYTFPMDVILVENRILLPKKVTIKKGTVATALPNKTVAVDTDGGKFIYNPGENDSIVDAFGISFKGPDNKDFILKWGDSFFGKVLNNNYLKIGEDFHAKFANL